MVNLKSVTNDIKARGKEPITPIKPPVNTGVKPNVVSKPITTPVAIVAKPEVVNQKEEKDMGIFKKIAKSTGKLVNWSGKLASNPVGAVAEAAAGVKLIKQSKGQSVTTATTSSSTDAQKARGLTQATTSSNGGFLKKAWEWVKANKKMIMIVAAVGVFGLIVYFFIFAKKGVRRKSPRRVSQAARMRAAKAAKRRK